MKRWLSLGIVVALLIAALALSQWRKPQAEVSPDAVLHFIGDTEQELSRLPMSATRLSDADEIRIGNELAAHYKFMEDLQNDTDENKQFRRYVEKVGTNVASHAQRKLPYQFHFIPDRYMINAFAIPGGHVYIGKGLLDLMDSEDELAPCSGMKSNTSIAAMPSSACKSKPGSATSACSACFSNFPLKSSKPDTARNRSSKPIAKARGSLSIPDTLQPAPCGCSKPSTAASGKRKNSRPNLRRKKPRVSCSAHWATTSARIRRHKSALRKSKT